MTATLNGHRPAFTDGDDPAMRVRAPGTPGKSADRPDKRDRSAYTRVIPDGGPRRQRTSEQVSLHVTEVVAAARRTRTLTELPVSIAEAWRTVPPTVGECPGRARWLAGLLAGLFRACVTTVTYGLTLSVATRLRAGVGLCLFVLCAAAVFVAGVLT